jgi:hypothetical protein
MATVVTSQAMSQSEGVEVGGEGADTAHGLGGTPRGYGDPVLSCADVDAGGVGVAALEGFSEDG